MYIKKLKITNYRNFGNPPFEMELKPFTLIVGENNTGKTNLLNAIGLIFSQEIIIFKKRVLEMDDFNYEAVKRFKNNIIDESILPEKIDFPYVMVEVILEDMDDAQLAVVGDWFIDKELTQVKITYKFSLRANWNKKVDWITTQRKNVEDKIVEAKTKGKPLLNEQKLAIVDFPIENYEYVIYGGDDTSNRCESYYLKMLKMEYLDALRDAKKELSASGDYRLLYKILNKKEPDGYHSIKSILSNLEDEVKMNRNLTEIKEDVEKLLAKVSLQENDADNRINFNFSSPETSEILKKISLIYGSNPVNIERNGLGRNNLLYISLILSQLSNADTNETATFYRIIGIEEPEAHLHPALQTHLAENIESIGEGRGDMQLLLTSHSTHIASKLKLKNTVILYIDRQSNQVKHHYILNGIDETKERDSIHYLTKYLDATKSAMFFSRKLILVEGISEQLVIPRFYEKFKKSKLEKIGCTVINVNGVAFKHFLKIIKNGFFIKCLVLTDSDVGTKTENRADELKSEFKEFKDIICITKTDKSTFEKDLIEANKNGNGKMLLLNALNKTRPKIGENFRKEFSSKNLDSESFFKNIADYKSEFAFNILEELSNTNATDLILPKYIEEGFDFIS